MNGAVSGLDLRRLAAAFLAAREMADVLATAAGAVRALAPGAWGVAAARDPATGQWRSATDGAAACDARVQHLLAGVRGPSAGGAEAERAPEPRGERPSVASRMGTVVPAGDDAEDVVKVDFTSADLPGWVALVGAGQAARSSAEHYLTAIAGQVEVTLRAAWYRAQLAECERVRTEHHEFLSITTHDLRTPLASIRGYAQLLLRQAKALHNPSLQAGLQTIVQQTDRLAGQTEVLLDIARIQTGRMALRRRPVDLSEVVRTTADALAQEPGTPPITVQAPDTGPILHADLDRLVQIARGLMEFAAGRNEASHPVTVTITADAAGAQISVEDAGPALDPLAQRRLFDRLVELDETGAAQSIGQVGLFLSRGAAEAHGGRAWVESPVPEQDRGARLWVWLPAPAEMHSADDASGGEGG